MQSLSSFNEQLLRAIGVGVALARREDGRIFFQNAAFWGWFGEPPLEQKLEETLAGLDLAAMEADLAEERPHHRELTVKRNRRTFVYAVSISAASEAGRDILVVECQNVTRMRELEAMIESYSAMVERNTREIEREKERVERLLLNIMPRQVYEEFKTFGVVTPQLYRPVSVLMLDFIGFVRRAQEEDPTVLVSELNEIFTAFDRIAEQYGCERIKTVGDAYLAVSGMPDPSPDHARAVAATALRFVRYLGRRNESHRNAWRCRIGIASGSVVGSVVGVQKYVYDVFGEAVNLASRLQTLAEPMQILADEAMRESLAADFRLAELGAREVRGFGLRSLVSVQEADAFGKAR